MQRTDNSTTAGYCPPEGYASLQLSEQESPLAAALQGPHNGWLRDASADSKATLYTTRLLDPEAQLQERLLADLEAQKLLLPVRDAPALLQAWVRAHMVQAARNSRPNPSVRDILALHPADRGPDLTEDIEAFCLLHPDHGPAAAGARPSPVSVSPMIWDPARGCATGTATAYGTDGWKVVDFRDDLPFPQALRRTDAPTEARETH